MSSLVLVRHGQASFFEKNYDRLSPVGEEQSRCLGRYWIEAGREFDEVYVGPRERHQKTADLVSQSYGPTGPGWVAPAGWPEFDEHHLEELLRKEVGELQALSPELGELSRRLRDAPSGEEFQRRFQALFEWVLKRWLEGAPETSAVESWVAFKERVRSALTRIREREGRGRRVVIFTSAGVIGVVLREALRCSDQMAMELGWRIRNGSVTEFVFSGGRFTLDSFNGLAHLNGEGLLTYR